MTFLTSPFERAIWKLYCFRVLPGRGVEGSPFFTWKFRKISNTPVSPPPNFIQENVSRRKNEKRKYFINYNFFACDRLFPFNSWINLIREYMSKWWRNKKGTITLTCACQSKSSDSMLFCRLLLILIKYLRWQCMIDETIYCLLKTVYEPGNTPFANCFYRALLRLYYLFWRPIRKNIDRCQHFFNPPKWLLLEDTDLHFYISLKSLSQYHKPVYVYSYWYSNQLV